MFSPDLYRFWQSDIHNNVTLTFLKDQFPRNVLFTLSGLYEVGRHKLEYKLESFILLVKSEKPVPFIYISCTDYYWLFPLRHEVEFNDKVIYELTSQGGETWVKKSPVPELAQETWR